MIILKYEIKAVTMQAVDIPGYMRTLKVAEQHGKAVMWCLCDPERDYITRLGVGVVPTGVSFGGEVSEDDYFGTLLMDGGNLVFHIFLHVIKNMSKDSMEVTNN